MSTSKRIPGLEFIRTICAVALVCYHFPCLPETGFPQFIYTYKNGGWGNVIVIIFFVLSGGVLYLNYSKIDSLKTFYYKRFKAIMPAFYLAFVFFFVINVIKTKTFFYVKPASSIILSITCLDGYFLYQGPNYYILGEWFLGAIILLYLIYPFLLKAFNEHIWITTIVVTLLFIWVICYNCFTIHPFRNLLTCLFCFYSGMVLFRYRPVLESKMLFFISALIVAVLSCFSMPFSGYYLEILYGEALFVVLYTAGKIVTGVSPTLCHVFTHGGKLSFPVFLVHHKIISYILYLVKPETKTQYVILLIIVLGKSIIAASVLYYINQMALNSKNYMHFENQILRRSNVV